MFIREIKVEDEGKFFNLQKKLDDETSFMLMAPGERKRSVKQSRGIIKEFIDNPYDAIFVVEVENELVGFILAKGNPLERIRHRVSLVIGIKKNWQSKGLGTMLFQKIESWAKNNSIHRLTLSVMTHNLLGLSLYKKMGFEVEGVMKDSMLVNGHFIDEFSMSKLI